MRDGEVEDVLDEEQTSAELLALCQMCMLERIQLSFVIIVDFLASPVRAASCCIGR